MSEHEYILNPTLLSGPFEDEHGAYMLYGRHRIYRDGRIAYPVGDRLEFLKIRCSGPYPLVSQSYEGTYLYRGPVGRYILAAWSNRPKRDEDGDFMDCTPLDGDAGNYRLENLAWEKRWCHTYKAMTPESEAEMVHLHLKGWSQTRIATRLGVTQASISYRIRNARRRGLL
jgi:hypothetical protein